MRAVILFIAIVAAVPAWAQHPVSVPPINQALSEKLLAEINAGLNCSAALIAANARIRELEDKYEKKTDDKK